MEGGGGEGVGRGEREETSTRTGSTLTGTAPSLKIRKKGRERGKLWHGSSSSGSSGQCGWKARYSDPTVNTSHCHTQTCILRAGPGCCSAAASSSMSSTCYSARWCSPASSGRWRRSWRATCWPWSRSCSTRAASAPRPSTCCWRTCCGPTSTACRCSGTSRRPPTGTWCRPCSSPTRSSPPWVSFASGARRAREARSARAKYGKAADVCFYFLVFFSPARTSKSNL